MSRPTLWRMFCFACCGLIAALAFLPGLDGDFVFDDVPNILHNPAIRITDLEIESLRKVISSLQPGGITRVLPTLSFAFDHWRASGLDPAAFKATNVTIHALTACVLAAFLHALLLSAGVSARHSRVAAPMLALAWAVHPLQVSSVLYAVQRMQTLCTLFVLLALLSYLAARRAQIDGRHSRTQWLLTGLCWVIALASKEDAVLLPAYALALELTVLQFRAASVTTAVRLRRGYLLLAAVGLTCYLFMAVPYHWRWEAYPGRTFSSPERLISQGRILSLHLGQILLPLPDRMPFYYDWLQPSRSLWRPWTTLPGLALILGLLALAWRWRQSRPLFAFGIFLFFSGHFITSNVLDLELVFEHRNHLPMLGIVLTTGDLLARIAPSRGLDMRIPIGIGATFLVVLACTTMWRAHSWNDPLRLAQAAVRSAPQSARAWNSICVLHYGASDGRPGPELDAAIEACSQGSKVTYAVTPLTNLVVFKTIRGDETADDWSTFHHRLQTVPRSAENRGVIWVLTTNSRQGVALDEDAMLRAFEIVRERGWLRPLESAALGHFIMSDTSQPDRALPFLVAAVRQAPARSLFVRQLLADLEGGGKASWARQLEAIALEKDHTAPPNQ